jgi:hypothetical protein
VLGRANWLFAGSLRAGRRAAAIMSQLRSARTNGHDPYAYLKDMLERLPTHKNHQIQDCCRTAGSRLPEHRLGVCAGRQSDLAVRIQLTVIFITHKVPANLKVDARLDLNVPG